MLDFATKAFVVFAAMTALDFVFAEYTHATARRSALAASGWASGIIGLTAIVTTSYIEDWRLIAPAALGAFVGTYLSVRRA